MASSPYDIITVDLLRDGKFQTDEDTSLVLRGHFVTSHTLQADRCTDIPKTDCWLYFTDHTGCMPCRLVMSECRLDVLRHGPFHISSWRVTLATDGRTRCLDINGPLAVVSQPPGLDTVTVSAVCVGDAVIVHRHRSDMLKQEINVYGNLRAVSEISSVNKIAVFLVTLEDDESEEEIHILVKRPEFLHWQLFLHPREQCVFEALRPTTLYKGDKSRETKVYAPTAQSRVHHLDNTCLKKQAIKEILRNVDPLPKSSPLASEGDNLEPEKFITFKGKVTAVDDSVRGVYTLDNKIRLCLTFLAPESRRVPLCEGTEIIAFNVHHRGAPQVPKIRLFACHRSCIKIVNFPQTKVPPETPLVPPILPVECLTVAHLEEIISAEAHLRQKFSLTRLQTRDVQSLVTACWAWTHDAPSTHTEPRTQAMEFLHHDTRGCLLNGGTQEEDDHHHQTFMPIHHMKDWSQARARQAYDTQTGPGGPSTDADQRCMTGSMTGDQPGSSVRSLNDRLYWSVVMATEGECKHWLLCGRLVADSVTGYIHLTDQSGTLPCVITKQQRGSIPDTPTAEYSCRTLLSPAHEYVCTAALNRFVYIAKYRLVTECFVVSRYPSATDIGDDRYIESVNFKTYLVFSMKDAYSCRNSVRTKRKSNDGETCTSDVKVPRKHLSEKSNSVNLDIQDKIQPSESDAKHCDKRTHDGLKTFVCQTFRVITKGCLNVQKRLQKGAGLAFYATVQYLDNTYCRDEHPSSGSSSSFCAHGTGIQDIPYDPEQIYVLYFRGEATKWYPVLHPGSQYIMCKPKGPDGPWRTMFRQGTLRSLFSGAVTRMKASVCVRVDQDVDIVMDSLDESQYLQEDLQSVQVTQRAPDIKQEPQSPEVAQQSLSSEVTYKGYSSECSGHSSEVKQEHKSSEVTQEQLSKVHSVESILNDDPLLSGQSVNVVGIVVARRFESVKRNLPETVSSRLEEDNARLGVSVPECRALVLTLSDPRDPSLCVPLYWRCDTASYPRGLLGGSRGAFWGLDRVVARSGRPYLSYGAAASHVVVSGSDCVLPTNQLSARRRDPAPRCLLASLWLATRAPDIVTVTTFVQQVLRVSLSAVCASCGAPWERQTEACERPQCDGETAACTARSSCIVDDGSGTAMVFCNSMATVAKLLALHGDQWAAVEKMVIESGDVSLQPKYAPPMPRPITALLLSLVASPVVRRSVLLSARRFRTFLTPGGDKHGSLAGFQAHDFPLQTVDLGSTSATVQTRSLPWLQLECVDIEDSRYLDHIGHGT